MPQDSLRIPFEFERQLYFIRPLLEVQALLDESALIHEGWQVLCNPTGARGDVPWDEYLKRLMRVVDNGPKWGVVLIFESKNQKPLGYTVLQDDTQFPQKRTLLIYAAYSNNKDPHISRAAMAYHEMWARRMGYVELHAQSRRLNGAAMRLFRRRLGFTPACVVFTKTL
jgi:hypothetical protein